MATTNVIINERNCPSPDVVDLLQQQEAIDTIVFSIYPFVRDDIDLSKYDCYVHITAGEWGKEEKLPYITSGGYSMTITWALDDDVLKNGNLVSYVLMFKPSASGSSVWETEEGTILTKIGIPADENIAGYYVQKLRATKNVIASLLYDDFFCYKFMPLGAWIFPILRTAGRIYVSSLSALSKCCAIEDSTGGGISISARSVSLNSPALLCAKNICDAMLLSDSKLRNGVPFCVNYGNLDNSGRPNIITTSGSTINFLVGGEYPPVTMTLADGATFVIDNIPAIYPDLSSDGDINIFLNKFGHASVLKNTIFRQHDEPTNKEDGDIWFDCSVAYARIWQTNGKGIRRTTNPTSSTFFDGGKIDNTIIVSTTQGMLRSIDNGLTWEQIMTYDWLLFCRALGEIFCAGGMDGRLLVSSDLGESWEEKTIANNQPLSCACFDGTKYYVGTTYGHIYSSPDLESWEQCSGISSGCPICDICTDRQSVVSFCKNGKIFKSYGDDTFVEKQSGTTIPARRARWLSNGQIIAGLSTLAGKILISNDYGESWEEQFINCAYVLDCEYKDGCYILSSSDGVYFGTSLAKLLPISGDNSDYNVIFDGQLFGKNGNVAMVYDTQGWYDFRDIPVGRATIDNGEISSLENFPINDNGYDINSGVVATTTTHGLIKVASADDEKDETNAQSSITPSNIFRILDYRRTNTEYSAGDIVGCPYHNKFSLLCTTAGTSSSLPLDTDHTISEGDTITDGSVIWTATYPNKINNYTSVISSAGDLVVGGSSGEPTRLGIGTNGQYLKVGSGGVPEWAAVDVGGGMNNPMSAAGDIIVGGSSGVPARLGIGTNGQYLKVGSGGVPEWAAVDVGGGMNNPMSAAGDIIVGGSSGVPTRLGIGTNGQVLSVNDASAGTLSWTTAATIAEQSLTNNGYVKFSNGLIIQWGYLAFADTHREESTITFPTTFSNKNYTFAAIPQAANTGTDKHSICLSDNAVSRTASTITVVLYGADSSRTFNGMTWIAVGY